jgi:predicted nuclease of predicted toxin-antitoxin system
MHFVVDAQLPPKLATCLAAWGHTAEHVFERFPQSVSDAEIWAYALKTKGIIVSN